MAFRGLTSTIPVGLQGFHGSRNPSKLGPGHLSFTEGLDLDGGSLIKEGGATKLNASALSGGVQAGVNWSPVPSEYHDVVSLDDGTVKKDTGAGTFATTLTTLLGTPSVYAPFFVLGGGEGVGETRKLFLFCEAHQVQVVEGTANTMAAIATPPADWATAFPIFGVQHEGRIWGGGNVSDPHRIYYSTPTDHGVYTGTGAGQLSIYPGEGEQLVGGLSFNGVLLLWKYPRGIYLVDTRDPDEANWAISKLTDAVGGVSPQSMFAISGDVIFPDNGGNFHLIGAANQLGDINTSSISKQVDISVFARTNINLGQIRKTMGVWYGVKSKAWYMLPGAGSTINNVRIVVDFNDPEMGLRYLISRRDVGTALWMRPDASGVQIPTLGDDEGFVWLMDQETRNKDGAAYEMEIETSEMDFGFVNPDFAGVNKNGHALHIVADVVSHTNIMITPFWDGYESDGISVDIGTALIGLDTFILDTHALGASGITTIRRALKGSGKRLRLRVRNSSLDEEVRISEFRVSYTPADDGQRNA